MHLESPFFLFLFAILPLLFVYLRWQRSNAPAIRIGEIQHVREIPRSLSIRLLPSLKILRFVVISLLIIALARPQLSQSQERRFAEGIDIILALDISESMRAEDVKDANRLETAKSVIRDFLRHRESDRIGLVVFSGESYTLCPLTLDYTVLIELLDGVEVALGGQLKDGTAIGDAIATTTHRLRVSETKNRIVILLTDGENNSGSIDPGTAASLAQSLEIKVYTIGMGKEGGALIPYEDTTFGKRYREVKTYLDEGTLKRIANVTGGRYFRATDVQSLKHVYTEIDQLEKTEFKVIDYTKEKEMAVYFLIPAALLFGLEVLLHNTVLRKIP
ncbi:VWA domain-containing protein [Candidatus Poribacteria bacterium]|nr:VWA domain-containing protein [Candidatus Poribacteria bacterium]MYF55032.1 VWA domain-containing protein [Candidatus Poribacteria bacterium]